VEEHVALDRLAVDTDRPPAAADRVALIDTSPGELDTDTAIPLERAAVQPATDSDETELAGPVRGELDVARPDQVDGVAIPPAHLHDPPPAGQRRDGPRDTAGHGASA
jgi:hypothetical protein